MSFEQIALTLPGGMTTFLGAATLVVMFMTAKWTGNATATALVAVAACAAPAILGVGGIGGVILCLLTVAGAWLGLDSLKPRQLSTGGSGGGPNPDPNDKRKTTTLPPPPKGAKPKALPPRIPQLPAPGDGKRREPFRFRPGRHV